VENLANLAPNSTKLTDLSARTSQVA